MSKQPRAPERDDPESVRGWRSFARFSLMLFLVALAGWSYLCAQDPLLWESVVWSPDSSNWIYQAAGRLGSHLFKELAIFGLLGFLVGAACSPAYRDSLSIVALVATVIATVLSLVIAIVARTAMNGQPFMAPSILTVGILAFASFEGSWWGVSFLRSRSFLGWLVGQMLVTCLLVGGGVAALAWFSRSVEPLEIETNRISSADRRRLVRLFQEHDPRDLQADQITELTLSEKDINQLATWGLAILPGEHAARIELGQERVSLACSVDLQRLPFLGGYLNLTTQGVVTARDGKFGYQPDQLAWGPFLIPTELLQQCGPIVVGRQLYNDATEPFLNSLKSVTLRDGEATVSYGQLQIKKGFVRDALVGLGLSHDLEPATREQVRVLIRLAEQTPDLTFEQCVRAVFAEAERRSQTGNAVHENSAAILALGYVLGHSKIRSFVGSGIPTPTPAARKSLGQVTLRGRRDWTKHYCVSAALKVLSNALASLDIGVLKEELDADGGSGFSFGDLLADRAGTRFAVLATQSESSAKAFQKELADRFLEADYMPDGSDLPEGLTDQEFQAQYGGVGGAQYNALLGDIDRRIDEAPGLKVR